jgi:hypothetical protein
MRGDVFCGICGARYTAEAHPSRGVSYYHCALTKGWHSNRGQNVPVERLEEQVADLFKKIEFPETFIRKAVERARGVLAQAQEGLDEERRVLLVQKSKLEEQRDLLENKLLEGVVDDEVYARNHGKLVEKIGGLKERIDELEDDRDVPLVIFEQLLWLARDIHRTYRKAPPRLKQRYLSIFWERIEVRDGKISKAIPTSALQALFTSPNVADESVITESNWRPVFASVITEACAGSYLELLNNIVYWKALTKLISEVKGSVVALN